MFDVSLSAGSQGRLAEDSTIDPATPLGKVWGRLTSAEREILLLHAWEGLSSAELGVALGVSDMAARQRLSRALKSARAIRQQLGIDE
jgi:RNA polymerase sigma-70 factor (ECF subfamily)